MFLDDKLYQIVLDSRLADKSYSGDVSAVNTVYAEVLTECENRIKEKATVGTTFKIASIAMDKVFNAYDSFLKKLKSHERYVINTIIHDMFKKNHFKDRWLAESEIKEIYLQGK